jgi:hypothetical protein
MSSALQILKKRIIASLKNHPFAWIAVIAAFSLSMIGANWGRVECWNLDQMAMRPVPNNLMVGDYLKPPLDTYVNRLIVLNPVDIVMNGMLHCNEKLRLETRLMGVRIFTAMLYCAAVALLYFSINFCAGKRAASVLSVIMGTSAGLLAFNHYATADSPLNFWMMASFACMLMAATGDGRILSIMAGLLAGLAGADKYNGIGVAVAIPVGFLVMQGNRAFRNPNLWLAGIAVPIGFLIGIPGVIFENGKFRQDFLYNLHTTPVYSGDGQGSGYLSFLDRLPELLGLPGSLALSAACIASIALLLGGRLAKKEVLLTLCALAVFLLYFYTIGKFPRQETRFVLPSVIFILLAAAPAIARIWPPLLAVMAIVIVGYNVTCSVIMGGRFADDPRMDAIMWAEKNLHPGDRVECTYAPSWSSLVPGVRQYELPHATGRAKRFQKILADKAGVTGVLDQYEKDADDEVFSLTALQQRNPDYVTFSSQAIGFTGVKAARDYYRDHLEEKLGYHKVFEATLKPIPTWAYPMGLDFVVERMTILKKDRGTPTIEKK